MKNEQYCIILINAAYFLFNNIELILPRGDDRVLIKCGAIA